MKHATAAKGSLEKVVSSAADFSASLNVDGDCAKIEKMNALMAELTADLNKLRTAIAKYKNLKANSDELKDAAQELTELQKLAATHKLGVSKMKIALAG